MDLSQTGMIIAVVLAIPLLVAVLWRPRAALDAGVLLVLLASTKFRHRDAFALLSGDLDSQIYLEIALYGIVLIITIRALLLLPLSAYRITPPAMLLGAYVGTALLSVFWSPNLDITFVRATQLLVLLAYAFIAVTVHGARRMLRVTIGSVVLYVSVFAGMAQLFSFADGTATSGIPRFTWFAMHPIGAGVVSGTAALFLLARTLFPAPEGRRRALGIPLWVLIAPLVWILFATQSRGPIFAFILASLLLLVRKYVVGKRALLTSDRVLIGLLAAGILLAVPVVTGKRGRGISAFLLRGQDTQEFLSLTGRTSLWDVAFESYAQRPVLGHGYLSAREVLVREVGWAGHAHNALIDSLFSVGLVGAAFLWAAFVFVLGASFLRLFRMQPDTVHYYAVLCAGMVFLLFNSVTGDSFAGVPAYEPLLLFILVLSYAALVPAPDPLC